MLALSPKSIAMNRPFNTFNYRKCLKQILATNPLSETPIQSPNLQRDGEIFAAAEFHSLTAILLCSIVKRALYRVQDLYRKTPSARQRRR